MTKSAVYEICCLQRLSYLHTVVDYFYVSGGECMWMCRCACM
jgi:hypothetical protein